VCAGLRLAIVGPATGSADLRSGCARPLTPVLRFRSALQRRVGADSRAQAASGWARRWRRTCMLEALTPSAYVIMFSSWRRFPTLCARSRADAPSQCIRPAGTHADDWLGELRDAMSAVNDVRRAPTPPDSTRDGEPAERADLGAGSSTCRGQSPGWRCARGCARRRSGHPAPASASIGRSTSFRRRNQGFQGGS